MSNEYVSVKIPKGLYDEILKRVKESDGEFKDVEEYVTFVLSEVVKEEDEEENVYSPEEEEEIKRRLKALGYL